MDVSCDFSSLGTFIYAARHELDGRKIRSISVHPPECSFVRSTLFILALGVLSNSEGIQTLSGR